MTSVLRKKIGAGGGVPPSVLQCSALWEGLSAAVADWARQIYRVELAPQVTTRRIVKGPEALARLSARYAFIDAMASPGALAAVSLDRGAAARYAAARLHQSPESLQDTSELFLKLMAENPARALWKCLADVFEVLGEQQGDALLNDLSSSADALDVETSYLLVDVQLAGESGEDGWLIEGQGEPPEAGLALRIDSVKQFVRALQAQMSAPERTEGAGAGTLRKRVRESTISLEAVLGQVTMTLADCSRLEIGQVLELEGVESGQLQLCADTLEGPLAITHGELGVCKEHRALKLRAPVAEHVVREIAEI